MLKPDLASLTLGSLNFPTQASLDEPQTIRRLADAVRERGVVPELEISGVKGRCLLVGVSPLHDVVQDVAAGLAGHGWDIDTCTMEPPAAPRTAAWRFVERALASRCAPVRDAARVARRGWSEIASAGPASAWMEHLEGILQRREHAAVIAHLDRLSIGAARMIVRLHPRPILVSLVALTQERRERRMLPLLRAASRVAWRRPLQADLLRPFDPHQAATVVVPSRTWRDEAIAAGLSAEHTRVVRLGVAVPDRPSPRSIDAASPARLLWIGRLGPEKGLHLFLDALPHVAKRHAVRLTAIAGDGPDGYARQVAAACARRELRDLVEIRPAVPRAEMLAELARHDLLLFHSVFPEPVAQVLLHAAAAGIPVVGPHSGSAYSLLRDGETAMCYRDPSPAAIAEAIVRALDDPPARAERAGALREEVRREHNLTRTIEQFDMLLTTLAGERAVA